MCGRITTKTPLRTWLASQFWQLSFGENWDDSSRSNIAPTLPIPVVRKVTNNDATNNDVTNNHCKAEVPELNKSGYRASMMRWGLVPSWATDLKRFRSTFNARSETAHELPSFRDAFAKRRCLIPVEGYYEWHTVGKTKTPHLIKRSDGVPILFAGLYETNRRIDANSALPSATIMTRSSHGPIAWLHERMPVIIDEPSLRELWLSTSSLSTNDSQKIYDAFDPNSLAAQPIDRL